MTNVTEGVRLSSKHRRLAIFLSLLVSLVTIGHEFGLFVLHYQVVHKIVPKPSLSDVVFHAIPSYLPVASYFCSCLVLLCGLTAFLTLKGAGALLLGIHTFVSVLLSITYPIQITIYLWTYVHFYLKEAVSRPGVLHPSCCCLPLNFYGAFIQNLSYLCHCLVEEEHTKLYVVETPPGDNGTWRDLMAKTDPLLQQAIFHNSLGNPLCGVNDKSTRRHEGIDSINLMLVGVEVCLLVMVLRMPLYMLWNDVEFYSAPGKMESFTLEKKVRGRRTSSVGVQAAEETSAQASETDVKPKITLKEEYRKRSRAGLSNLMPLTFAVFLDGCDAFSLLDLFRQESAFYYSNNSLKNLILIFITLDIFVLNFANFAVTFPKRYRTRINTWLLLVVISGNLPFLFIRSVGMTSHGGLERLNFGDVYTLFMVKEVTLIVMATVDYGMRECSENSTWRRKKKQEETSFDKMNFAAAFDLSASIASNRSAKYLVHSREKRRRESSKEEKINEQNLTTMNISQNEFPAKAKNNHWVSDGAEQEDSDQDFAFKEMDLN